MLGGGADLNGLRLTQGGQGRAEGSGTGRGDGFDGGERNSLLVLSTHSVQHETKASAVSAETRGWGKGWALTWGSKDRNDSEVPKAGWL